MKKIGRNLLLFQQAEMLIKRLVALGSLSTRGGESVREFEQRASFCNKMTMGQVTNLFLERSSTSKLPLADFSPSATVNPQACESSISIRFHFGAGADPEERRQSFDRLKEQRNDLVHHLLSRIDPDSAESCDRISNELDEQRRQILPEIQRLQQDLRNVRASIQMIADFLETPEGLAKLFLPEIQQSPLIRNLATIAAENPEPEGWTQIGEATKRLKDFPHEKIQALLDQFHQKSLTALLHASRLFDIRAEPTDSGHDRMFYRLKSAQVTASGPGSVGIPASQPLS